MKKRIVLYDEDLAYAEMLTEALSADPDFPYPVTLFTDYSKLDAYLGQEGREGADVLVTDEATAEKLSGRKDLAIVLLTTEKEKENSAVRPAVYKFQPAAKTKETLRKMFSGLEEGELVPALIRAQFIGVVSPVGRALKTGFALTLGQLLSRDRNVLFLSLEMCAGYRALFGREFSADLSDLLYAEETGRLLTPGPDRYHGMDVIAPVSAPEDLYPVAPEKVRKAVLSLAEQNDYDTVVLDMANDYRLIEAFLPLCRQLYMPVLPDPLSEAKAEEFRDYLRRRFGGDTLKRLKSFVLPAEQALAFGEKDLAEQLVWTGTGDFVRSLLGGNG